MQALGCVSEQVAVLVDRAALRRHVAPEGGQCLLQPRTAVDDQKLWLAQPALDRSEEHTSELQSLRHLVCRLLLEKKKVSLKVGPGESQGIIGHNGAGKTTSPKVIGGIYQRHTWAARSNDRVRPVFEFATGCELEA